ncbi:MAG: hypothetical protein K8G79_04605 [bacterium]|uniref:Uncharacterized protein n=1 Tax=Candidatus Methylomirabilis tolerans TaxID=3123416 RepID=A0AAJ1AH23_9BACT|nr:hypothetical protein [Candidatus Methylomirabilis sp.]
MKKFLTLALAITFLVAFAGLSVAQQQERKVMEKPATSPPAGVAQGKDQCADHKNNANKYTACQKAARLGSGQVGGGPAQQVSVCSGGYWWTGGWGGWTQGGPCSPEGAIK